ncbi:hypothetical protein L1887_00568 [Cichorium endivia]|nr:hypothetical protein L1887_00568 [Cichorium endivia]
MGTGSPLNTYAPPPPVPGDFYLLVPSSPAYRTPCLDLSLTSDCRAIIDSQTLEIAAPLQYRSPITSMVLSTASKHQRSDSTISITMIDVFPLHRRKLIDPLALNPFGCLYQPLPPFFAIEDSIYQNMLPTTDSLLEIVKDEYQWRK